MSGGAQRTAGRFTWVVAAVLAIGPSAWGQLRVATWNISNYTGGRAAELQTAVYGEFDGRSLAPDILLVQEVRSAYAAGVLRDILNAAPGSPGDWAVVFNPGDSGAEGMTFLYRGGKFIYRGSTVVSEGGFAPEPPRDTVRYRVWPQGYAPSSIDLHCYNSHMKAGSDPDDLARRLVEAERIRADAASLPAGAFFLLGGDFNIQASGESAYQELVGAHADDAGRFFDPIATPGGWNNNCFYRFVHTQDPIGAGGMDDRYDQLLVSANLVDGEGFEYIGDPSVPYSTATWNDANHSYRAWGNDGSTCNAALRVAGNTMVGPEIAQALRDIAGNGGHLPVMLDIRLPALIGSDPQVDFGAVAQGATAEAVVDVWNAGDTDLWGAAGIEPLTYELVSGGAFAAPPGSFVAFAGFGANAHVLTLDTSTPGVKSGELTILSNGWLEPVHTVTLVGEVVPAGCPGDYDCDGDRDFFDIDFLLAALGGESVWTDKHTQVFGAPPACEYLGNCDANRDGVVDFFDIDAFLGLLGADCAGA